MQPTLENYRVISVDDGYKIQHKYDLFTGFNWHTVNVLFKNHKDAFNHMLKVYEIHLHEYERLKEMGKSFPDND
ncbi:MAG: hypothetical protein AB7F29_13900 [Candidatus Nitrosocosmicus sp.]